MARVLYFELLLLVGEPSVLLVELLGHVCHHLEILVEIVLSDEGILIALLFLERVSHELRAMRRKCAVQFPPHLVLLLLKPLSGSLLEDADLVFKVVDKLPDLIDRLLLRWPLRAILYVIVALGLVTEVDGRTGRWIILSDSNVNVFHLFLVITFIPCALKWLLTDSIDIVFHVLDHLAVLLFTEDVILLLCRLGLFQLLGLIVLLHVN